MAVGVPGGDVEIVQHLSLFDHILLHFAGQLGQQSRDDVPPCLLPEGQMERFDGFLRRLR